MLVGFVCSEVLWCLEWLPVSRLPSLLRGPVRAQLHHDPWPEPDLWWEGMPGELHAGLCLQGIGTAQQVGGQSVNSCRKGKQCRWRCDSADKGDVRLDVGMPWDNCKFSVKHDRNFTLPHFACQVSDKDWIKTHMKKKPSKQLQQARQTTAG